mmetsp:Transcript_74880/g.242031  ORF Transcript_74880/g.242031 Transcript_74880/m.242031 type:complete len:468 (+) Transcript_74880:86-1489(+)
MLRSAFRGSAHWSASRWWQELRAGVISEVCAGLPANASSISTVAIVRGEAEASRRLDRLIAKARRGNLEDALTRGRLASLLDLRGEHEEALALLPASPPELSSSSSAPAAALPPAKLPQGAAAAMKLLRAMAERHAAFAAERNRRLSGGTAPPGHGLPLDIVDGATISPLEVFDRFIQPGQPCVIRNAGVAPAWTPELLMERLGSRRVPLRRCESKDSVSWAQLEFAGAAPFDDFAREHVLNRKGTGVASSEPQLFDFSIWQHCADALADDVVMPKWFPVDLYTQASAVVHPVTGSASPTVFLAAEGTFSGLHVDFLHTHFWMTLCHGHKRWRVVPRDDLALLYPRYLCDLNPCFPTGLDEAERAAVAAYNEMPALGLAAVHEVILGPGDIVFVPAGAPHKVENLETTVAISANFVDRSNVARSLAEAELLGLVSEDPVHIAACFRGAESGSISLWTKDGRANSGAS